MKRFLLKLCFISLPLLSFAGCAIYMDVFKVLGFQDYYKKNDFVALNRGMVYTKTFNYYREKEKYNSFIMGSSRSQAYKCKEWIKYLDNDAKPFHFDSSGEGIWGIAKKINYIAELGDTLKNVLIVLDRNSLILTDNAKGHLFVAMPCVSKNSYWSYYKQFAKASFNYKFIIAYCDFILFHKYRDYMGDYIMKQNPKYQAVHDKKTCDWWYAYDKHIKSDSIGYYREKTRENAFDRTNQIHSCPITSSEIALLEDIKSRFILHSTNYKIVISPIFDQIPMEKEQIDLLYRIFGKENVYNFSGKNKYTENIGNYYENSHYRPHVANEIMHIVYSD